ncbi:hypothetical protein KAM429_34710 [Aquipseudomonas alcaligenes]|uniref:Uncharacterized protein n=1 Tax=Aquipseudomonas alcaligenes TaxID=43263 RepID=A0AA37FPW2_AQUAC|nr:hypothetical protein KAM426_35600 [Pseudomonas alcaligenes]GIZ68195.1 hypothetical protein KAM428_32800 [Pseudomonas alcaligenes]GIZ72710.1 hypothetical protein KAM429_34710 [Pseudomonas alcaligenes]GIZ77025.1 hypothetical protein KAM430_34340 [Pseudomonas alcaligenes]GIZ81157.1 hypothetical protein KAM432_32050 [Pseudomonas alcaligenes]
MPAAVTRWLKGLVHCGPCFPHAGYLALGTVQKPSAQGRLHQSLAFAGRRYAERFAVLGDSAAGYLNALCFQ